MYYDEFTSYLQPLFSPNPETSAILPTNISALGSSFYFVHFLIKTFDCVTFIGFMVIVIIIALTSQEDEFKGLLF